VLTNSFSFVISTFQNDVFACNLGALVIRITSIVSVAMFPAKSFASIVILFIQGISGIVVEKLEERISKRSHIISTSSPFQLFTIILSQFIFNDSKFLS
jgi:hypothetical protein